MILMMLLMIETLAKKLESAVLLPAPVVKAKVFGKLLPNCEAKTVDEELFVKGSSVMQGYYKMPEEIENKFSENRIIQEVLVRDSEGVIEAEISPDYEYANKKRVKDLRSHLQGIIDDYNLKAPLYKRVIKLKIRETEFEKIQRRIKRF